MKMFLSFSDQQERRKYGGSCFLELQYCHLPPDTPIQKRIARNAIEFWRPDSVYVHGDAPFFAEYGEVLGPGISGSGNWSGFDSWGLNYYPPEVIPAMLQRLLARKPREYTFFLSWLEGCKACNGFYILGI